MLVREATVDERRELGRPLGRRLALVPPLDPRPVEPVDDPYRARYAAGIAALRLAIEAECLCLCGEPEDVPHVCVCSCGRRVDRHPPLPRPVPLSSWKAQRRIEGDVGWDGRKVEYPGRAAAARGRDPRRPRTNWK